MDGTGIKELERLVKEKTLVEVDGLKYSPLSMSPVIFEPKVESVQVHTLSGLVGFIRQNSDKVVLSDHFLVVENPYCVSLGSKADGLSRRRDWPISAELDKELKTFSFGTYKEVEEFIIGLRSMFEPTADLEKVIKYISRVSATGELRLEDDGITQNMTVKKGTSGAVLENETSPAVVKLRPYRTFRDIEQTESEFLFRMKMLKQDPPTVGAALFEADGGRWRHLATQAIKTYLEESLPNITVIA